MERIPRVKNIQQGEQTSCSLSEDFSVGSTCCIRIGGIDIPWRGLTPYWCAKNQRADVYLASSSSNDTTGCEDLSKYTRSIIDRTA